MMVPATERLLGLLVAERQGGQWTTWSWLKTILTSPLLPSSCPHAPWRGKRGPRDSVAGDGRPSTAAHRGIRLRASTAA
jgi:hypothetical protein